MSGRVRVYDAKDVARKMRRTFADRAPEREIPYDFDWPVRLQNVGDSIAVAYASDKWQPKDRHGKRLVELYKHLAESRNRCLAQPGVLVDYHARDKGWPVIGPMVTFESSVVMPDSFAVLGLFEECCLQLHTEGDDEQPEFGAHEDDGVVHVKVRHGLLGGSKLLLNSGDQQPFLFVFTRTAGVVFVMVGEQLDIEKDGIVG